MDEAIAREKQLKGGSRGNKLALIGGHEPTVARSLRGLACLVRQLIGRHRKRNETIAKTYVARPLDRFVASLLAMTGAGRCK